MDKFEWKKLGRVFDPSTRTSPDWMTEFAQAPATLLFDDFVRVYFSCRPPVDERGQYVSYSGFVDLDRNDLLSIRRVSERPILSLGELGTFDEFGTYPVSVIRMDDQLIAYYGGWTRCESVPFNVAIGYAVSRDGGETFEKIGAGPILSYSVDEPFILSGPKIRRFREECFLFYIAGRRWVLDNGKAEPVYKIRMATSRDGVHWRKAHTDLIPDVLGENEAQASPDVFFRDGRYHMFFCFRQGTQYRGKERGYRIGYAWSENLMDWTRDDSVAGIDVSADGWDSEMISYPHVFEIDGHTYMLYLGNQVGRFGFGLAELSEI